jgi:hypothetical protein
MLRSIMKPVDNGSSIMKPVDNGSTNVVAGCPQSPSLHLSYYCMKVHMQQAQLFRSRCSHSRDCAAAASIYQC